MDAVKYFKEKARMTKNCSRGYCINNCPLGRRKNSLGILCYNFELIKPDEAVKIVEEWAKAHPQKTRKQDFFEKYPNAPKDDEGYPKKACCIHLGYCEICKYEKSECCYDCWDEPVEE